VALPTAAVTSGGMEAVDIPVNSTDGEFLTHLFSGDQDRGRRGRRSQIRAGSGPRRRQAMKYLAFGWWQMMAVVDCSGCSWNPSLTSTPMRSAPSSSTTLALSSSAGQAG